MAREKDVADAEELKLAEALRHAQELKQFVAATKDEDASRRLAMDVSAELHKAAAPSPAAELQFALEKHLPALTLEELRALEAKHNISLTGNAAVQAPAAVVSQANAQPDATSDAVPADPAQPQAQAATEEPQLSPEEAKGYLSDPGSTFLGAHGLDLDIADAKKAQARARQEEQVLHDPIELAHKEASLKIADDYAKQMADLSHKFQAQVDGQLANYHQAVADMRATTTDPWLDRGIGWTVASALFMGLNQMGLAMVGSNAPNVAVQMVKGATETALQRMQLGQENARTGVMREGQLLERMQQVFGDKKAAMQATRAALLDQAASQAETQLQAMAPEIRSKMAEQTAQQLRIAADESMQKTQAFAVEHAYKAHVIEGQDALHASTIKTNEVNAEFKRRKAAAATAAGSKLGASEEKVYSEFVGALSGSRGAPDVSKVKLQLVNARTALDMVTKYKNLDDMPKAQYYTFLEEVLKTATGGVPTESAMHHMLQETFGSKLKDFESKAAGEPMGAGLGKFIQQNVDYLKEVQHGHQESVKAYEKKQFKRFRGRFSAKLLQRTKEDFPELFADEAPAK